MPKVHHVTARTDRYRLGAKIEDPKTKKGYRIDKSKPRDESDTLFCKKGEKYYHFQRYGAAKVETLTRPKPSQLTGSEFLSTVYQIDENFSQPETFEQLESWIEETKSELETLMEETEDKLNNLPDQLQYAPVGETLQGRVDSLQEWIDGLDNIECEPEVDEATYKADMKDEFPDDDPDEVWAEYLQDQLTERIEELQTSYEGE